MRKCLPHLALSAFVVASPAFGKVIYGADNRVEVYEGTKAQQLSARSAATMIPKKSISSPNRQGIVKIDQTSLKQFMEKDINPAGGFLGRLLNKKEKITFCKGEKFVEQPSAGVCSGFLIAPDLLMTAGHCMDTQAMCDSYNWVFDYQLNERTKKAGLDIPNESVYSCKRIVSSSLMTTLAVDFGIIQLDRKVTGRAPLKLRKEGEVKTNEALYVVGSPSGLPLKVADGAKVRESTHPFYFKANLDTFQGNSGSAVFNEVSGEVEGILVEGDDDYKKNARLNCIEVNRCSENGCNGEKVFRTTAASDIMIFDTLSEAINTGDVETVEEALRTKVWIDFNLADGETALIKAAKAQDIDILKLILSQGANRNHTDSTGKTALDHAKELKNEKIINILQ